MCCGARDQAFKGFEIAQWNNKATIVVLLVDAEGPVNSGPRKHLTQRDGWDLGGVSDDDVHLMIRALEAWIVADPATLKTYYGQYFNANILPKANNLEAVPKLDVANALNQATRDAAPKGVYHKIKHASQLLRQIDPMIVQRRCPSCARLFDILRKKL